MSCMEKYTGKDSWHTTLSPVKINVSSLIWVWYCASTFNYIFLNTSGYAPRGLRAIRYGDFEFKRKVKKLILGGGDISFTGCLSFPK